MTSRLHSHLECLAPGSSQSPQLHTSIATSLLSSQIPHIWMEVKESASVFQDPTLCLWLSKQGPDSEHSIPLICEIHPPDYRDMFWQKHLLRRQTRYHLLRVPPPVTPHTGAPCFSRCHHDTFVRQTPLPTMGIRLLLLIGPIK